MTSDQDRYAQFLTEAMHRINDRGRGMTTSEMVAVAKEIADGLYAAYEAKFRKPAPMRGADWPTYKAIIRTDTEVRYALSVPPALWERIEKVRCGPSDTNETLVRLIEGGLRASWAM